MKKYAWIFLIVASLGATSAFAQKKTKNIVYLKNGSSIKGNVLSHAEGKIVVETADGSQWVFSDAEVSSVETAFKTQPQTQRTKGFINMSSFSVLAGTYTSTWDNWGGGGWEETSTQLSVSIASFTGYQFSQRLAIGGVLGIDGYSDMPIIPLGVGVRGDLFKGNSTMYYGTDLAYGFPVAPRINGGSYKGGLSFSPSIGFKRYGRQGGAYFFQLGWKLQNGHSSSPIWGGGTRERTLQYRRLGMGFGLQF